MILNLFLVSEAPSALLYLAAILGSILGSVLALTSLRFTSFLAILVVLAISAKVFAALFFQLPLPLDVSLKGLMFLEQGNLGLILIFLISFLSWLFWRHSFGLAIETLFLVISLVTLLANHRNYRFDLVKLVNDLAWSFKISPLAMLVVIGTIFFILISLYVVSQNLAGKPETNNGPVKHYLRLKTNPLILLVALVVLAGVAYLTSFSVYNYHQKKAATLVSSGVGQEDKEGLSPLNFHQSLGKSNQPMALMRLDSEYKNNPNAPTLYLRETALSEIKNNNLVNAPSKFNPDVPRIKPGESYQRATTIANLVQRRELLQSIYLIAQHKLLFSIDYPTRYTQLALPQENKRFKEAFRALSLVPEYNNKILPYTEVGSANWSNETKQHFLATHPDERYTKKAQDITSGISNKTEQALAVIQYFNKNAIYTLTPNHKVGSKDDATAAFLFGDMRGYCVHFAHAITFMLRSLGIPTRIASGYMVDLSQSRDGHVLLRASDRHAWAEVYIRDIGWVPFDPEPEQVESHAETPVDFDLLDQLMAEIGEDQELLPELNENELPQDDSDNILAIEADTLIRFIASVLLLVIIILALSKVYLRYSWRLTKSTNKQLARLYRAIIAILLDAGYVRSNAETRQAYRVRIKNQLGIDLLVLTPEVLKLLYGPDATITPEIISKAVADCQLCLKKLPPKTRWHYYLNPAATINFLMRRGW